MNWLKKQSSMDRMNRIIGVWEGQSEMPRLAKCDRLSSFCLKGEGGPRPDEVASVAWFIGIAVNQKQIIL